MSAENVSVEKKPPKIISVINYKGGVGKTTVVANLGAVLAKVCQKRVLLVDVDPQSNLTAYFVKPAEWKQKFDGNTIKKWFDAVLESRESEVDFKSLISTPKENFYGGCLKIIPSDLNLIKVDMKIASRLFSVGADASEVEIANRWKKVCGQLRARLEEISGDFDLVLIDCPPNLNIVTQNAIIASDGILVPTLADSLSVMGMNTLMGAVKEISDDYNKKTSKEIPAPKFLGVAFTMTRRHAGGNMLLNQEREFDRLTSFLLQGKIPWFSSVLPINTEHTESAAVSRPLMVRPDSDFRKNEAAQNARKDFAGFVVKLGKEEGFLCEECIKKIRKQFSLVDPDAPVPI